MFNPVYKKDVGLYIHIPFCTKKCHYCAFAVVTDKSQTDEYIEVLIDELREKIKVIKVDSRSISTVYFGGGTPSTLSIHQLSRILKQIDLTQVKELSIEINPEDVTKEYILGLKNLGFNRVSLGVQTLQQSLLTKINRVHDESTAKKSMTILGESDISWNADIILGMPFSSPIKTLHDVQEILTYHPTHISLYFYTKEHSSVFGHQKDLHIPKEKDVMKTYQEISALLSENGYEQYEFSNWSQPGYQSKHNLMYWLGMEYIGVGPSASSFYQDRSLENVSNLNLYLTKNIQTLTSYSHNELAIRYFLVSLRLKIGTSLEFLLQIMSKSELELLIHTISHSHFSHYFAFTDTHIALTPEGKLFHNNIIDFLADTINSVAKQ